MKFNKFMNSLLTDLIPQKFKVDQNFYREIHVQKALSLSILNGFQQMRAENLD